MVVVDAVEAVVLDMPAEGGERHPDVQPRDDDSRYLTAHEHVNEEDVMKPDRHGLDMIIQSQASCNCDD